MSTQNPVFSPRGSLPTFTTTARYLYVRYLYVRYLYVRYLYVRYLYVRYLYVCGGLKSCEKLDIMHVFFFRHQL
jgi:hypothetical protein